MYRLDGAAPTWMDIFKSRPFQPTTQQSTLKVLGSSPQYGPVHLLIFTCFFPFL